MKENEEWGVSIPVSVLKAKMDMAMASGVFVGILAGSIATLMSSWSVWPGFILILGTYGASSAFIKWRVDKWVDTMPQREREKEEDDLVG